MARVLGRLTARALIGVGLVAAPARADASKPVRDEAASSTPGRFDFKSPRHDLQVALGTGILVGLSAVDEWQGDTVSSGMLPAGLGPSLAVRYQWPSAWSAGIRAVGMFADDRFSSSSGNLLGQFAAEGRWQPEGELGPYVEFGLGSMVAIHRYRDASSWQWAPLVESALGFDVGLVGPFALGFELRGALTFFSADGESFVVDGDLIHHGYGTTPWVGLNVIVSFGL